MDHFMYFIGKDFNMLHMVSGSYITSCQLLPSLPMLKKKVKLKNKKPYIETIVGISGPTSYYNYGTLIFLPPFFHPFLFFFSIFRKHKS